MPAMKALQLCNRSPNVAGAARSYVVIRSRSHGLRTLWGINGNAVKARCAANHDQRLAYTGRSASSTAFPRGAWEREKFFN